MMFKARRCVFAEDLADATFERVMRKLTDLTIEFTGDPARYFYGVAKKIYLEYQRKTTATHSGSQFSLLMNTVDPDLEKLLEKLDEALTVIPESDRELILSYYTGSGKSKINYRRALAEQFGLGPNALRLRVFRIRREIRTYMSRCSQDALIKDHGLALPPTPHQRQVRFGLRSELQSKLDGNVSSRTYITK
jgi:DNA-directed RNA polymerase specialized sigma24 family protein